MRPEVGAPITTFRLVTGGGGGAGGGVGGTDVGGPDVGGTDACNWYTVTATRELALSTAACVARG